MGVSSLLFKRRIVFLLLFTLIGLLVLWVRLFYVQIIQGDWLLLKAEDLWSRDVPFEAKRGRILDRNGVVLVDNESTPSILAVPVQIEDVKQTVHLLAPVLNMAPGKLERLITKRELIVRIHPEGRKMDEEKAEAVRALALPGIYVAEDYRRFYPYGTLAAHVLGFTGVDNQGLTGLELSYDDDLKGKRGAVSFYADARGRKMPDQPSRFIPPIDGDDLVTTLDVNIQMILEREMEDAWSTYQPKSIIGVVMDPRNGEVLAMASYPTYDPAHYQDYSQEVYNRNQPIWRMYEPGSTFKIITLATALKENKVDLYNEHFFDPGYIMVAGAKIRCWKPGGHGDQTFLQVVENSCNPGFVELGQRIGKEKLMASIRDFGFGQKTGIDLKGEATGLLFRDERMGPVELATTAFGQGVSVTPIQQVAAVSAAINGGAYFTPHLGKSIVDPKNGERKELFTAMPKRQVIDENVSEQVRKALEAVVANGTGYRAYVDGFRVGGKTGTAQKVGPDGRYLSNEYIVSFIGFAPADDPKIVVYLAVDHPQGIQFGGVVAAPIVGRIIEETMHYLKVPPREDGLPKTKYIYPERPPEVVPDLVGKTIDDIRRMYYALPLDVVGEGRIVIDQSPKPGSKIETGQAVRIYLGP
ncbi:MAG: stage V sporulation protein D [Candidatus Carbobacillus altaicus]|uniref:Cell division protein FtsI [Peptidoglycan synthetase] n=1 Tax=Candidatus Carbonibacillus altaicus TaxID=2163959 RepID=A0A2R6Y358_9BACL|nr:stage V sporulation protein D [Candidatus Carbobacillus altaicus]PTQ57109.1 MAG: Cell division protein FtsI [Peptidoglycan synthetase] [Candidatus Carbobacillus altaicus]